VIAARDCQAVAAFRSDDSPDAKNQLPGSAPARLGGSCPMKIGSVQATNRDQLFRVLLFQEVTVMSRDQDLQLMHEYVQDPGLRRHMLAVEAALRAYAQRYGEDPEAWGTVGLLHDFDYERWPNPPDHPLQGAAILRERGYDEKIIYAILSHADYLQDEYPRQSLLDRALYACDELCGFIIACALVRPTFLENMKAKSVKKKMKQASFAAAVPRDDLLRGAEELGVDFDAHVQFCIDALQSIAGQLADRS
jgi:putative nucleotidyltransferase with HDIG domain